MTPPTDFHATLPAEQHIAAEMAKYGITRIPADYFYYKEFRYTRLEDAVAHAKRQQRLPAPDDYKA